MATSLLMEYLSMARTQKARTATKKLAKEPKCMVPECGKPAELGCRGRCRRCFNQHDYDKRKAGDAASTKSEAKRLAAMTAFDQAAIDAGTILPSRRGNKRKPLKAS